MTVGLVDERGELAGCYQGVPQNDVGMRTDVLDGCPKAEGMQLLIRSMSPAVVAVDELGKEEDFRAVESVIHCGCTLLATAHGNSLEDIMEQPFFQKLKNMQVLNATSYLAGRTETAGPYIFWTGKGNHAESHRGISGISCIGRNGLSGESETVRTYTGTGGIFTGDHLPER